MPMTMIQRHRTGPTSRYFQNLIICHSSLSGTRLVFYCWTKASILHTGHSWDSSVVGIWKSLGVKHSTNSPKGKCNRGDCHSHGGYSQETPIGIQWPSGHAKAREAAHDLRISVLQQQEINLQPRGAGKMKCRRLWPSRGHCSLHLIPDPGNRTKERQSLL